MSKGKSATRNRGSDYYRYPKVIAVAKDCEDLKDIVVYQNTDKGDIWTRPLDNFCETVTRDGKTFKRFERIG